MASDPAPSPPSVSMKTILMAGLQADVYGLDELSIAAQGLATGPEVTVLWLFHGRKGSKEEFLTFGPRVIGAWLDAQTKDGSGALARKGLVAVAFDQRNHGTRLHDEVANEAWKAGNPNHAVDMFASVVGMVGDARGLMDVVGAYLFPESRGAIPGGGGEEGVGAGPRVVDHLVLGVSLGGHAAWQTLFSEDRVKAGVVIIGCPDYVGLMSDRARKSKLPTFTTASDPGFSFVGSRDFPPDLLTAVLKHDPKGLLFGTNPVAASPSPTEQQRLGAVLDTRVRGKTFLLCSGKEDKLVPYAFGKPLIEFLETASKTWWADGRLEIRNKVYEGAGHEFSAGMAEDSIAFMVEIMTAARGERGEEGASKMERSRI